MPVAKSTGPETKVRPRVLVVDDEPNLVEVVSDVVKGLDCRIVTATTLSEAKRVLASHDVEVLVTDINLPDGDGTSLLEALHSRNPTASAIVMTGAPSVATATAALRKGAVDFLPKPFSNDHLAARVRTALELQARAAKGERKVQRLRLAVKKLNEARRLISKKVDLLCNDLVAAYGELSRQVEGIRTVDGFRKSIEKSADLEQLLCHAMDWLLRQIGYSNVAVWLAGDDGEFQLGAYMKYTVPGEEPLIEGVRRVVLPLTTRGEGEARDVVVRARGDDLRDRLKPDEFAFLRGQELLAINCTYLGESLAALVFFRDVQAPFSIEDEHLLKAIGPVFAIALAAIVRDDGSNGSDDDGDADDTDEGGGLADDPSPGPSDGDSDDAPRGGHGPGSKGKRNGREKRDAADWWKRGEPPPF